MFVDGNVKRGNIADVGGFFGNNRNFFDEVQNLCVVKLVKSADAVSRGNALGNGGVRLRLASVMAFSLATEAFSAVTSTVISAL